MMPVATISHGLGHSFCLRKLIVLCRHKKKKNALLSVLLLKVHLTGGWGGSAKDHSFFPCSLLLSLSFLLSLTLSLISLGRTGGVVVVSRHSGKVWS